ncbi:dTMP kinase [Leptospira perolatii]|uniref:Thymidylate kinase n=1 Tax=Leptospira perolatii TaxID=2023191 RepID=A0A2M9ZNA4_9LEPT|nr:dTMP kinase [Leptospira perolatii]PJZ69581.1 dTMP kinase [Leptospira perolatii]PJZ73568.1 dTMP kinase [Leptospira perolatii]
MTRLPAFFVFEGLDGSGKSTLCRLVLDRLIQKGVPAVCFSEPTQYETGLYLRKFLRGEVELDPQSQIEAFLKDREASLQKNILPAISNGSKVLLDRYIYSTCAYQSGSDFSAKEILKKNLSRGFPEPEIVFYLDLEPSQALQRLESRQLSKERFESIEHLDKIRTAYEEILPFQTIRLDANQTPESLAEQVVQEIL